MKSANIDLNFFIGVFVPDLLSSIALGMADHFRIQLQDPFFEGQDSAFPQILLPGCLIRADFHRSESTGMQFRIAGTQKQQTQHHFTILLILFVQNSRHLEVI